MRRRSTSGYILIETTVAVIVLGISAITIHGVIRQAIQTRGQALDYTHVRFLMQDYMARIELQPLVFEGSGGGVFEEGEGRFSYTYNINAVNVPIPMKPPPKDITPEEAEFELEQPKFEYNQHASKLLHVALTVHWRRGDMNFSETIETLLPQEKLYVPPVVEEEVDDVK